MLTLRQLPKDGEAEFFGGLLNSAISALAFTGLLITIFLQRLESRSNQAKHEAVMRDQRFFQLLTLAKDATASISREGEIGRTVIDKGWKNLCDGLPEHSDLSGYDRLFNVVKELYSDWRDENWRYFGNYFECLFVILDRHVFREKSLPDRMFFFDVFRSQLGEAERNIMLYEMLAKPHWAEELNQLDSLGMWRGIAHKLSDKRPHLIEQAQNFKRLQDLLKAVPPRSDC
jgi:hypothetical protein